MTIDEIYMQRAIQLAKSAAGLTYPNPMVGAIIVKGNKIVAQGYHKRFGDLHAERNAINQAIAKGIDSMTNSYPFYPEEGFKAVGSTFALIPDLYEQDVETPMSAFLREQLKEEDLWSPLRKNFKTKELFSHAVQERIDGLRILQYLKTIHEKEPAQRDETHLISFCKNHGISISDNFSFIHSPVAVLNETRDRLFELEMKLR